MKLTSLALFALGLIMFFTPQPSFAAGSGPPGHDSFVRTTAPGANFDRQGLAVSASTAACTPTDTAYLQWDLSGVPDGTTIETAFLALTANYTANTAGTTVSLYETSDGWLENSLTLLNAPAAGALIEQSAAPVTAGGRVVFSSESLAAYLNAQAAGDNVASLAVRPSQGCVPGLTLVRFDDDETATGQPPFLLINPSIAVEKQALAPVVVAGQPVTFTIRVENTSDVELYDVTVDDPLVPACNATLGSMASGAVTNHSCALLNATSDFTNTVDVVGFSPVDLAVRASDTAFVEVEPPTAVVLASFVAALQGQQIMLTWESVSEIDNLGFNVLRSQDSTTPETRVAFVPSQAPGASQGSVYQWFDGDILSGNTYYYWLEDVDISGATTLHGPVSTTVQTPSAVAVSGVQIVAGLHAPSRNLVSVVVLALLVSISVLARRR